MFIEHLIKTKQLVAIYPIRSCGLILQQSIVGLSCLRARIVIAFEKNVIIFIAIHGRKSQPIGKLDIEVKVSHKLIGSFLLIIPLQVIQVICSIAIHPIGRPVLLDQVAILVIRGVPREINVHDSA